MDSSAGIISRMALTWNEGDTFIHSQMGRRSSLVRSLCQVPRVRGGKTDPAFEELTVFRPGSHVSNRQLEFSYPFDKCLLSISSVLGTDLAGTRKRWSLPLENIPVGESDNRPVTPKGHHNLFCGVSWRNFKRWGKDSERDGTCFRKGDLGAFTERRQY